MMSRLTSNLSREDATTVEKFSWYFVPVGNPDGYFHTWQGEDADHRFWRKNRNPNVKGGKSKCGKGATEDSYFGVDLNRNFDMEWNHTTQVHDPCHETYAGEAAFSEVETRLETGKNSSSVPNFMKILLRNIRDYSTFVRRYLISYSSIHSFGQLVLLPWSFTNVTYQHHNQLYAMVKKVQEIKMCDQLFITGLLMCSRTRLSARFTGPTTPSALLPSCFIPSPGAQPTGRRRSLALSEKKFQTSPPFPATKERLQVHLYDGSPARDGLWN